MTERRRGGQRRPPTLRFLGAAGQVTGSCYVVETEGTRLLLECGLFQGPPAVERLNRRRFAFDPRSLDAVVLSHAHLDHSGLLPRLVRAGYAGPVYVTRATRDLMDIMLRDAAHLQRRDAEWENKWRQRAGRPTVAPLYGMEDVDSAMGQVQVLDYGERVQLTEEAELCFHDAGHILGSAVVELRLGGAAPRRLVFSGDLGSSMAALLPPPARPGQADTLLLESTYGDRNHRSLEDTLAELEQALEAAATEGGNVIIPAFAVGRTQELIYRLGELYRAGRLRQQQVWLDSPMAIAATEVYRRHLGSRRTGGPRRLSSGESDNDWLPILRYSETPEQSMALNRITGGAIIIAGSGMCNGGRVRHHLKYNLWRRECRVIISGFQVQGTPGRALVDGAQRIRLLGSEVAIRARIHTLGGLSAHAGQDQLVDWAAGFGPPRPRLFLVHGETDKSAVLQERLRRELGWVAQVAEEGLSIRI